MAGNTPQMSTQTGTLYWLGVLLADAELDPTETLLMIGLADHVDANDECWVSIDTLATYARVSYITARRRLAELAERGRIERSRRRRSDGNLSTYTWRLVRPGLAIKLSDDHRSPGRAMIIAHLDERAEVPSVEVPSVEEHARSLASDIAAGRDHKPVDPFDEFWTVYPKRVAKGAARTAWKAAAKKEEPHVIVAAAASYRDDPNRDPRFTKHPATWLHGECWNDEPDTERRHAKSTSSVQRWLERTGVMDYPEGVIER